jgi:hypothetical protein
MKQGLWAIVLLAGLGVGCQSGRVLSGGALVHPQFPYSVTYDDEKKKSVLGDDWLLENYRRVDTLAGSKPSGDNVEIERKDGYDEVYDRQGVRQGGAFALSLCGHLRRANRRAQL